MSSLKTVSVNMAVGHLIFNSNNFEFKTVGSLNLQKLFYNKKPEAEKLLTHSDQLKDSRSKIQSLIKNQEQSKDYLHLSNFLKDQIFSQRQAKSRHSESRRLDTVSNGSKVSKCNNQLIELASREIKALKNSETKLERLKGLQNTFLADNSKIPVKSKAEDQ